MFVTVDLVQAEDAVISPLGSDADCETVEETDRHIKFRCPGVFGVDVWMEHADGRWQVSFHKTADGGPAYAGGFNHSNDIDLFVEWRFDGSNPVAAIQRWRFYKNDAPVGADPMDEGVWMITRIDGERNCPIGLVEIAENHDALALARRFADQNARDYSCEEDPVWVGVSPQHSRHAYIIHR